LCLTPTKTGSGRRSTPQEVETGTRPFLADRIARTAGVSLSSSASAAESSWAALRTPWAIPDFPYPLRTVDCLISRLQNDPFHFNPRLQSKASHVTTRLRCITQHLMSQLDFSAYRIGTYPSSASDTLHVITRLRCSPQQCAPLHSASRLHCRSNQVASRLQSSSGHRKSPLGSTAAHFTPSHNSDIASASRQDSRHSIPPLGSSTRHSTTRLHHSPTLCTPLQPRTRLQCTAYHLNSPLGSKAVPVIPTQFSTSVELYFPPMVKLYLPQPVERSWPIPWIEPYSKSVCRISSVITPSLSTFSWKWKDSVGLFR
jgi:hypothetical protein